jgi:exopolysaccharide biosynthesis protein
MAPAMRLPFVAILGFAVACQSSSGEGGGLSPDASSGDAPGDGPGDALGQALDGADATRSDDGPAEAASSVDSGAEATVPLDATSQEASAPTCPGDGGLVDVWCDRPLTAGVVWRSRTYASLFCGPQRVNVLDVDLGQTGVSARPVQATVAGYETVTSMGARTGAIAGINGGFFCNGSDDICTLSGAQPTCDVASCSGTDAPASGPCLEPSGLSLLQIGGQSLSTNCKTARATLALDATGRMATIADVAAGAMCSEPNAIGAGPTLVVPPAAGTGAGTASVADESFHWPCTMHPRTAVAIDQRGHLLLVTLDGGHGAAGMTLPQAGSFLVTELGARQAMNFDGGGSTAMYVKGTGLANLPSTDNGSGPVERAVYDGLFVYAQ